MAAHGSMEQPTRGMVLWTTRYGVRQPRRCAAPPPLPTAASLLCPSVASGDACARAGHPHTPHSQHSGPSQGLRPCRAGCASCGPLVMQQQALLMGALERMDGGAAAEGCRGRGAQRAEVCALGHAADAAALWRPCICLRPQAASEIDTRARAGSAACCAPRRQVLQGSVRAPHGTMLVRPARCQWLRVKA